MLSRLCHHAARNSRRRLLSRRAARSFSTNDDALSHFKAHYDPLHAQSIADPEAFWSAEATSRIDWITPPSPETALNRSNPPFYEWFPEAELNTCYNALDRHVEAGRGDMTALILDSPVTGSKASVTYTELLDRVARFAGGIASLGVEKGDRVLIYMPMTLEACIAMLACSRLGAVHSVVFGGFASAELAVRIDDATPKVVVASSCGIEPTRTVPYKELIDNALELADHAPSAVVIHQRPENEASLTEGRDVDFADVQAHAEPHACVPVKSSDPLYVLYTSGTTGQPKGIVRDNGGHATALAWSMEHIYGVKPNVGDVFWAASDIGWVVGHSYVVYGPLIAGCTSIVFEGKPVGTPDASTYWRICAEHKVKRMFTAPTAFRALRAADPEGSMLAPHREGMSGFEALFLAGERSDPDTLKWAEDLLQVPVYDHFWQTESGWPIVAPVLSCGEPPVKHGSAFVPVPGYDVRCLAEDGTENSPGELGAIAIKLPLPPGTLTTLYKNEQRFVDAYFAQFEGYYTTHDAGIIDDDSYVSILTRTDDVINVAGHRLSTSAMEEVLYTHTDVAECAVLGVHSDLKGQVPLGLVVLKAGAKATPEQVCEDVVQLVRERIGPVAFFKQAAVVARLPKTRSGKILRGTIQKMADGTASKMPATVDDPASIGEMEEALKGLGFRDIGRVG